MNLLHNYTLINCDRARIGAVIYVVASLLFYGFSWLIAAFYPLSAASQLVVIPVSIGSIYVVFYLMFNNWLWKYRITAMLCNTPPCIAGTWACKGVSIKSCEILKDANGNKNASYEWNATVKILQTWSKMLIVIKTEHSSSYSIMASFSISGLEIGPELAYCYYNTPNNSAPQEMRPHDGFCRITFSPDLTTAEGTFFTNARDRVSHGTMKLTKEADAQTRRWLFRRK